MKSLQHILLQLLWSTSLKKFLQFYFFFLALLVSNVTKSQDKFSIGASVLYNFPLEGVGLGIRAQVPVIKRIQIVPQFKYMPSYNAINEYYGGLNVHYLLYRYKIVDFYAAAGGMYNRWINYAPTESGKSKKNNILPEAGIGTSFGGENIRGFVEMKYNILWNESYMEAGVLISPFGLFQKKYTCPTYY